MSSVMSGDYPNEVARRPSLKIKFTSRFARLRFAIGHIIIGQNFFDQIDAQFTQRDEAEKMRARRDEMEINVPASRFSIIKADNGYVVRYTAADDSMAKKLGGTTERLRLVHENEKLVDAIAALLVSSRVQDG